MIYAAMLMAASIKAQSREFIRDKSRICAPKAAVSRQSFSKINLASKMQKAESALRLRFKRTTDPIFELEVRMTDTSLPNSKRFRNFVRILKIILGLALLILKILEKLFP